MEFICRIFSENYPGQRTFDYWIVGLVATLFFFAPILLHELSHAAMANWLGENVRSHRVFHFRLGWRVSRTSRKAPIARSKLRASDH